MELANAQCTGSHWNEPNAAGWLSRLLHRERMPARLVINVLEAQHMPEGRHLIVRWFDPQLGQRASVPVRVRAGALEAMGPIHVQDARRKHERRRPSDNLAVAYVQSGDQEQVGVIKDVSMGGACLVGASGLRMGQIVQVRLGDKPWDITAVILRSQMGRNWKPMVQLVWIDPPDDQFQAWIDSFSPVAESA